MRFRWRWWGKDQEDSLALEDLPHPFDVRLSKELRLNIDDLREAHGPKAMTRARAWLEGRLDPSQLVQLQRYEAFAVRGTMNPVKRAVSLRSRFDVTVNPADPYWYAIDLSTRACVVTDQGSVRYCVYPQGYHSSATVHYNLYDRAVAILLTIRADEASFLSTAVGSRQWGEPPHRVISEMQRGRPRGHGRLAQAARGSR